MHDYGFLSIAPPILTVVVAIYSRNVILALIVGIVFGSLIITDFQPFDAVLNAIEDQVLSEISSGTQAQVVPPVYSSGMILLPFFRVVGFLAFPRSVFGGNQHVTIALDPR